MIVKRIDRINSERNGTKIIDDSEIGASDRSARALLQSYRWARLTVLCPSGRVLLGLAFDRHEAHGRALHGFANRLGVSSVVLLPLYKRLEIGPRDQPHDMAELAEFATPVIYLRFTQGIPFERLATLFSDLLGLAISMDGKGSWRGNVFVEQLWRSVKYEEVYLRAYESAAQARASIGRYLEFYNAKRPHSSLDRQTPDQTYFNRPPQIAAA